MYPIIAWRVSLLNFIFPSHPHKDNSQGCGTMWRNSYIAWGLEWGSNEVKLLFYWGKILISSPCPFLCQTTDLAFPICRFFNTRNDFSWVRRGCRKARKTGKHLCLLCRWLATCLRKHLKKKKTQKAEIIQVNGFWYTENNLNSLKFVSLFLLQNMMGF